MLQSKLLTAIKLIMPLTDQQIISFVEQKRVGVTVRQAVDHFYPPPGTQQQARLNPRFLALFNNGKLTRSGNPLHYRIAGVTPGASSAAVTPPRKSPQKLTSGRAIINKGINKIIIMPCAGSKKDVGHICFHGKRVSFVANPGINSSDQFRPDDLIPGLAPRLTWREAITNYNTNNLLPDGVTIEDGELPMAYNLYANNAYHAVANAIGYENLYILSAGWGFVKSTYKIPFYDITFSPQTAPLNHRTPNQEWADYNQFPNTVKRDQCVHSMIGVSYFELFERLFPREVRLRFHHMAGHAPGNFPGRAWDFQLHPGKLRTNWYYQCARNVTAGHDC